MKKILLLTAVLVIGAIGLGCPAEPTKKDANANKAANTADTKDDANKDDAKDGDMKDGDKKDGDDAKKDGDDAKKDGDDAKKDGDDKGMVDKAKDAAKDAADKATDAAKDAADKAADKAKDAVKQGLGAEKPDGGADEPEG